MPPWLFPKASPDAPAISLEDLARRLIAAALLGALTAALYHIATWTRGRPMNRPFLATLMLLRSRSIEDIMEQGLHEFIEEFIVHNNRLGEEISDGYRFYR